MANEADLEMVADAYRSAMHDAARGELTEFPLTRYDRTGIPVHATVWDYGDRDAHGVGYGRSDAQAVVGGLGELAERVLMSAVIGELRTRRASRRELVAELGERHVVDPVTLVLDAGADYDDDRALTWLPAVRWRTGEPVLVPAEFAAFDGGSLPGPADGLITPITNGMGAGDSAERAVAHGLLELVQRDGDNVVFRALDAGVVVDLSASEDPATIAVLGRLRAAGIDPIVKLASTEFACVTYCVGRDDDPTTPPVALSAIGEAAHPDRDVSVTKALLEFASSRARRIFAFGELETVAGLSPDYLHDELRRPVGEQEPRALDAMRTWTTFDTATMNTVLAPIFAEHRSVSLSDLPTSTVTEPKSQLDLMLDRLHDFDVLVIAGERAGMHVAKVLAPGLEVESMSYLRLGERAVRQLLGSDLVGIGPASGADRAPLRLTADAVERLGGPAWVDRAAVARTVGELYPLYREPRRHAVQRIEG